MTEVGRCSEAFVLFSSVIAALKLKGVAEPGKMLEFLASRGEEFNLRPVTRLNHAELLCNKVLLKNK